MAMLGDILAAARHSTGGFQAWLEASNPELGRAVAEAARRGEVSTGGYARMAVADFSRFASEEDWVTLISSIRDSADPGTICLTAMVDWRLNAAACDEHSLGDHDLEGADDGRLPA